MRCKGCRRLLETLRKHRCAQCGTVFDPTDPSTFDEPPGYDLTSSMRCKGCRLSLENLVEHRCPECGRAFDPNDPSTFDGPWTCDRKSIMRCQGCGYLLKNLVEHRCPECGRAFDPNDLSTFDEPVTPTRPTLWHALVVYAAFFVGGGLIVLLKGSDLSSALDTVSKRVGYGLGLVAVISAVMTTVDWLATYIRWRRFR